MYVGQQFEFLYVVISLKFQRIHNKQQSDRITIIKLSDKKPESRIRSMEYNEIRIIHHVRPRINVYAALIKYLFVLCFLF